MNVVNIIEFACTRNLVIVFVAIKKLKFHLIYLSLIIVFFYISFIILYVYLFFIPCEYFLKKSSYFSKNCYEKKAKKQV